MVSTMGSIWRSMDFATIQQGASTALPKKSQTQKQSTRDRKKTALAFMARLPLVAGLVVVSQATGPQLKKRQVEAFHSKDENIMWRDQTRKMEALHCLTGSQRRAPRLKIKGGPSVATLSEGWLTTHLDAQHCKKTDSRPKLLQVSPKTSSKNKLSPCLWVLCPFTRPGWEPLTSIH